MNRTWVAASALVGGTLVLAAIAPPDTRIVLIRFAIFAASLVVALRFVRRVAPASASAPELFDIEHQAPAEPSEIPGIRRLELDVQMATVQPFGTERLKPLLRELAIGRLLGNRGIDMERAPEAARHALGEPLWRLIEPGVARGTTGATGHSAAEIEAAVDRLEQL